MKAWAQSQDRSDEVYPIDLFSENVKAKKCKGDKRSVNREHTCARGHMCCYLSRSSQSLHTHSILCHLLHICINYSNYNYYIISYLPSLIFLLRNLGAIDVRCPVVGRSMCARKTISRGQARASSETFAQISYIDIS